MKFDEKLGARSFCQVAFSSSDKFFWGNVVMLASSSSTVVEHLPSLSSTVVEHMPRRTKVKGSCPETSTR
jgi:hypothetical protein